MTLGRPVVVISSTSANPILQNGLVSSNKHVAY